MQKWSLRSVSLSSMIAMSGLAKNKVSFSVFPADLMRPTEQKAEKRVERREMKSSRWERTIAEQDGVIFDDAALL